MRPIGPPSKGTLSTKASSVNQLHLPQLAAATPTPTATDKPPRVVVDWLYDKTFRVVERPDALTPRPAVRSRVVAPLAPTPTTRQPRKVAPSRVEPAGENATRDVDAASPRAVAGDRTVRVILIGCSKKKRAGRHPARALYQGALFKAELAHAQRLGAETFVVSAKHGLVQLDTELEAYDYKLRSTERDSWAWSVCVALRRHMKQMKRHRFAVTILAGETYAEPLRRFLETMDPTIEVVTPLAGLSLGSQLRWFRVAAAIAGGAQ